MTEAVEWLPDGTPRSPRFGDIYRSRTGGLGHSRHVFLHGCGLPAAWAGQTQWRILETGFGLGLNFLAVWRAWKDDPERPRMLHFASIEAWPVSAADLVRSAEADPELVPLAQELAAQWHGLLPGAHRLTFEGGHVLLTLFVGDVRGGLRQQPFYADSIFLDGFEPHRNPVMWDVQVFKAVARHSRRGTRVAIWTTAGDVRRDLAQCGFVVDKADGLAPMRHHLQGEFAPAWEPKGQRPFDAVAAGHCAVIGSGLAGASVAASLARRGWLVTVLDAAGTPAGGASGLPVGLLAPNFSPDDNLLSRLSRAGVRLTLEQARALLCEGTDWQADGVLEQRLGNKAVRHEQAGWIKPGALVEAWLRQPGITWLGNAKVAQLVEHEGRWRLIDANGEALAIADLVVVCAAHASAALLEGRLALQAVRGQVSWGSQPPDLTQPSCPVNGNGHFIPHVPQGAERAWYCGSTFDRGDTDLSPRDADHHFNLERLRALLPEVAARLAHAFTDGSVKAWTGIRCASNDRRPLLGEVTPGLWVSTAMGSRGLTFAVLCAELLAARLHGEPLPLERRLALALDVRRRGAMT
ncbi:MAG: tRNA (5-methylaminomethyl-2-thiouridine)(34)-methyltransferase MnmD [Ramlibacter sp.]